MRMTVVLPAALTLVGGLSIMGMASAMSVAPTSPTDPFRCGIQYADHNAYTGDLGKQQLIDAPKEVRQLPGTPGTGWLIVLKIQPTHTTEAKLHYESFPVVSDKGIVEEAVRACISEQGWP